MFRLLVAAAAILIAAVVFLILGTKELEPGPDKPRDSTPTPDRSSPAVRSVKSEPVAAIEREEESAPPIVNDVTPVGSNEESNASDATRIHGRFLFPGGAPVVGMSIKVHGWGANSDRIAEHGVPEDWEDPASETDSEGQFAVRFDPPRAFQFTLDAKIDGYAGEGWRWSELEPGSVVDLGEIELRLGGRIRGRVVNKDGEPLPGYRVYAESGAPDWSSHETYYSQSAKVQPETAEFLLIDLPAGKATLTATHPNAGRIGESTVTVRAGDTVEHDLVYDGPDLSRRIAITAFSEPIKSEYVSPESIHLRGPGGLHQTGTPGRNTMYFGESFLDLPPGSYSIEIDDPKFLTWRKDNVPLGSNIRATLKGNAAILLTVTDATTGLPIPQYGLNAEAKSSSVRPNTFALANADHPPPENGLFDGLTPGDYRLTVSATNYPDTTVDVDSLAPHENRSLTVSLSTPASLSGGATCRGVPVPDARVWMLAEDEAPKRNMSGKPTPISQEDCDDDGSFRFGNLAPGTWWFQAVLNNRVTSPRVRVDLAPGTSLPPLRLELPPHGIFRGRVGDWLVGTERLKVRFSPLDSARDGKEEKVDKALWRMADLNALVDDNGAFESPALPFGPYEVALLMPPARIPTNGGWSQLGSAPTPLREAELDRAIVDLELATTQLGGSLEVSILVDGVPGEQYTTVLTQEVEAGSSPSLGAVSDERGVARFSAVIAGDWTLRIAPSQAWWAIADPIPVRILAGSNHRRTVVITLHEHQLEVHDGETGEPVRDSRVSIEADFGRNKTYLTRKTDSDGTLTLKLPVGDHTLVYSKAPLISTRGKFRWKPDGAVPNPVQLIEVKR